MSSSERSLLNNMQHSQETDIHAYGGIRTRNPNKWTAADARRKHLVLKCTPKLNTECEFNFVAHCTWDLRLSQRCLWGLLSITDRDNLPVIRRNLLLLSSGGIGSGRWGSLSRNLNTYLPNCMVSHPGNMFRWMACASTVLRTGQKVNVNLYHVVKPWRGGRVIALTTMTLDLEAAGWSTPRSDRFTPLERPRSHFTGGWVGYGYGKSRQHRQSNPGPSSLLRVVTASTLSRSPEEIQMLCNVCLNPQIWNWRCAYYLTENGQPKYERVNTDAIKISVFF
jgi:hypothetical protein